MNLPISKLCKKCADKIRAADKKAKRIARRKNLPLYKYKNRGDNKGMVL